MSCCVYAYPFSATTSSYSLGQSYSIQNAPSDVDYCRWSVVNDGALRLYTTQQNSNTLYRFTYNATSNAFVYDTTPGTISISNAPADADFSRLCMGYDGTNALLFLRSLTFFDIVYKFVFNATQSQYVYAESPDKFIRIVGAPEATNWATLATTYSNGTIGLLAFEQGNVGIYSGGYDATSSCFSFAGASTATPFSASNLATVVQMGAVAGASANTLYLVYDASSDKAMMGITTSASIPATTGGNRLLGYFPLYTNYSNWMSTLPNQNILLSQINLPGSHDSASINKLFVTPYSCQDYSLTDQMKAGIRFLDIRVQILYGSGSNGFEFWTCHGDQTFGIGVNQYQSLSSAFDECQSFLQANPTEALVMSLKIDDNSSLSPADQSGALGALVNEIWKYQQAHAKGSDLFLIEGDMPTLEEAKGKIFLINRVDSTLNFGAPVSWNDNTPGMTLPPVTAPSDGPGTTPSPAYYRSFPVYVQDQYKNPLFYPTANKASCIENAFGKNISNTAVINFWSGLTREVYGVYTHETILNYLGQSEGCSRSVNLGWCLLDYPLWSTMVSCEGTGPNTCVDLIIDSNLGYSKYPNKFKVIMS